MSGDFNSDFSSDFGDGRPPRSVADVPVGAMPGMTTVGRGWTIWIVDRQSPFSGNTSNVAIAAATKRYQLIRVRDVYHDVSAQTHRVLDDTKFTVNEFDVFSEAQAAFIADSLTYAKQVRAGGIAGLFQT